MSQYFSFQDAPVSTGDTVKVHQEISEGSKTRVQVFEGLVIAIQNAGTGKSFVVRRIGANGIAVERIIPVNLPTIKKIEVVKHGKVHRSKLFYLRDKIGKMASTLKTVFR